MDENLIESLEWNDRITHLENYLMKLKLEQQERCCTMTKLRNEYDALASDMKHNQDFICYLKSTAEITTEEQCIEKYSYDHQERYDLCIKLQNEWNSIVCQLNEFLRVCATNENDLVLENYTSGVVNPSPLYLFHLEAGIFRLKMRRMDLLFDYKSKLSPGERRDFLL